MPNTKQTITDSSALHPKNPAQSVKELCNILKELRKSKDLSQQTLSEIVGVSAGAISKYETGENSPSLETLIIYSQYFDVSIDYLLDQTKDHKRPSDARPYHTADSNQLPLEDVIIREDPDYTTDLTNTDLLEIIQLILNTNAAQIVDSRKVLNQSMKLHKQLDKLHKIMDHYALSGILAKLSTNNSTAFLSEVFGLSDEQIQTMINEEQQKST